MKAKRKLLFEDTVRLSNGNELVTVKAIRLIGEFGEDVFILKMAAGFNDLGVVLDDDSSMYESVYEDAWAVPNAKLIRTAIASFDLFVAKWQERGAQQ